MEGRASYAARRAMVGPELAPSIVARNAVGTPPTPRSTCAPCFSRNSVSQACAFSSLKQSSGLSWILCDSASRSFESRSTASATFCFRSPGALISPPLEFVLRAPEQGGLGQEIERRHRHSLRRGERALARERAHRGRL